MTPSNPNTPNAQSPTEAIRDRLTREWSRLKDTVRTTFHRLTDEDVHAVDGRYDELSSRIAKTYGYDRDRTDEEISRFVSEGGNSAPYAAVAEEAQSGDHRGMGAEAGRNDKPLPLVPERPSHPGAGPGRGR